jgi:hypothetical protein
MFFFTVSGSTVGKSPPPEVRINKTVRAGSGKGGKCTLYTVQSPNL